MVTMVGRDQELAALLSSLTSPQVALTLVTGDAGIGKSRLVAEVAALTPQRLALVGGCLPLQHVLPLLPAVDALDARDPAARRALTRAVRSLPVSLRPHIAGVMPRTLPEEISPAVEVRRDQLFLATEALLSRVAEEQWVTFVVEDVHWADPDTLDLLTYLAGARRSTRLSVVATCRADETLTSEPVAAWLDLQRRSSSVHELRLEPLSAEDVRRLVAELPYPDGANLDRLATSVFARGEGNPFFTEQLVASVARGEELPERLARLLSARVQAVSPSAQKTVTALAVLGRPVPVEALRVVTEDTEEACLAAVRELEAASLVVHDNRGVRPRHALLTEAVLAQQPGFPTAYHRRVAVALETLDDASALPEIADHRRRAGDEAAELRAAQLAAQRAWDLGGFAEAARWYLRVTELHAGHHTEPLLLTEPEVVRRSIRALDNSGDVRAAIALAEQAVVDFAERADHPQDRLKLLTECAHMVGIEDPPRGHRLLTELLPAFQALPPHGDHSYLLSRIGAFYMESGDNKTALGFLERAVGVAQAAGDLTRQANALSRMSGCHRYLGDRAAADRCTKMALHVSERSGADTAPLYALVVESDNRLKYAEFRAAIDAGERGIEFAQRKGLASSHYMQLLVNNTAEAYLALGQIHEVGRLVDALTDQPHQRDDMLTWLRAHADLCRGDPHAALTVLGQDTQVQHFDPEAVLHNSGTRACVLAWNRQPGEALEVIETSLPGAAVGDFSQMTGSLFSLGARVVGDLADNGDPSGAEALARLDDLRETLVLDPFADRVTFPRGSADRRQWRAERTRAVGQSDPDAWAEAASAWEALSMSHDAAYCWWRAAQSLLAAGASKTKLRTALQTAHRLSHEHVPLRDEVAEVAARARLPVLAGPDTDGHLAAGKGLTTQEAKVLRLLAGGYTNAEIGAALTISPKTASVHVSNLIRKLDVSNRTEAATWATRNGMAGDA